MATILLSMIIERCRSRGLAGCMARIAGWFLDRWIDGGREGMHAMDTIPLRRRKGVFLGGPWFAFGLLLVPGMVVERGVSALLYWANYYFIPQTMLLLHFHTPNY